MNKNNNHGGARKGAGRKKGIPNSKPKKRKEETMNRHTIYLKDEQWEIFIKEGGSKTLRKLIDENKFKKQQ